MPMLRESQLIALWTFLSSTVLGYLCQLVLHWPWMPVYTFVVLTVGPALAIWRGKDRSKDPLDLAQRAVAEIIALIELIAIGTIVGRWL